MSLRLAVYFELNSVYSLPNVHVAILSQIQPNESGSDIVWQYSLLCRILSSIVSRLNRVKLRMHQGLCGIRDMLAILVSSLRAEWFSIQTNYLVWQTACDSDQKKSNGIYRG